MGFSFPRAALGLTVFLSLSLGWISFQYYQQKAAEVNLFELEASGVESAKQLTLELLEFSTSAAIPRARAAPTFRLLQTTCENRLAGQKELKNEIQLARDKILSRNDELLTDDETTSISRLLKGTLLAVLDQCNLILDPSLNTFYYVEALFAHFPDVIFYNNSWQELLDFHAAGKLMLLHRELGARQAAFIRYKESLEKALHASDKAMPAEGGATPAADLTASTMMLFAAFDGVENIKEQNFNRQLNLWREKGKAVLIRSSEVFSDINQKRLVKSRGALVLALGVCLVSWLISLAFLAFIVYTFMTSRRVLQQVIQDQREALSKAQKLATLGEISASIGHEITNPLTVIKATTELLEKNFGKEQPGILKHSERIRRMAVRIEDIVRNMKAFLNGEKESHVQATPVDLMKLLEDVKEDFQDRLQSTNTHLNIESPQGPTLMVMGNYNEFVQVFTNLLNNALDAVKNSATKEITIRIHDTKAFAEVEIQDSGEGVPPELRSRIFEALFTTKNVGEGTGLGLSIAQKILSKYHGHLRLTDKGPGACFEISLNRYLT